MSRCLAAIVLLFGVAPAFSADETATGKVTPRVADAKKIEEKRQVSVSCMIAEIDLAGMKEFDPAKYGLTKLGADRIDANTQGGFAFSAAGGKLHDMVRALKAEGRIDILNNANLQLLDNQQGVVSVGQIYPYFTSSATTESLGTAKPPTLTYRTIGVTVQLTPRINPDGRVSMHVEPGVVEPVATPIQIGGGITATAFSEQAMDTTILADDGETVVVGGLISEHEAVYDNKIPFFGDLPYVGNLFHYRTKGQEKQALIVVLTPHIVRGSCAADTVVPDAQPNLQLPSAPPQSFAPQPMQPLAAPATMPHISAAPVAACPYLQACPTRAVEAVVGNAQPVVELLQGEPIVQDLPAEIAKPAHQQVQMDVMVARVDRSKLPMQGKNLRVSDVSRPGSMLTGVRGMISADSAPNVVFGIVSGKLSGTLETLKAMGAAKILAEPKLVTRSGQPAHFLSGGQQAVLSSDSDGTPSVTYVNVGVEFDALPIIRGDGRIYLEVNTRVRSMNEALGIGAAPGFDEQEAKTSVVLEDNQTFAIGGLIQIAKPTDGEQELVILVTPHLVDAMDCSRPAVAAPAVPCPELKPCGAIAPCPAQPACPESCCGKMNLADVAALAMSKVSDDIILNQIRTTDAVFRLGAEEIIWLKKNGVSDRVVMEMQNSRLFDERTKSLLKQFENSRTLQQEKDRFWFTNGASTMSYEGLNGYIGP